MIQEGQLIRDFQGGDAPASLKPGNVGSQKRDVALFPGSNRPGLIEACPDCPLASLAGAFPGSNRPGLIEATVPYPLGLSPRRHFRGVTAPASLKRV